MYPKHQISILQRFLKDRMTLKTGVMIKKKSALPTRIIYILKYNKIAKISYYLFLVNIRDLFDKIVHAPSL